MKGWFKRFLERHFPERSEVYSKWNAIEDQRTDHPNLIVALLDLSQVHCCQCFGFQWLSLLPMVGPGDQIWVSVFSSGLCRAGWTFLSLLHTLFWKQMNRDECILIEVTFKRNLNGQEQSFEYGNVLIACTPCREPEVIVNLSVGIPCHFPHHVSELDWNNAGNYKYFMPCLDWLEGEKHFSTFSRRK